MLETMSLRSHVINIKKLSSNSSYQNHCHRSAEAKIEDTTFLSRDLRIFSKTVKVSMNFFTVYLLYGEWKFGNYICDEMD